MDKNARWALWATCVGLTLWSANASAADNIVLYASDASVLKGNWSAAADATAAGGRLLASAVKNGAAATSALASPPSYVEFTFSAPAGTPYRVWLRLRAAGDSKKSDSLYAQFSDAVGSTGAALFPIGTTDGLVVNLQSCQSCQIAGWGWPNGAYWLTQETTVRFASSGTHTLRVQAREDGVGFDQVVLSPSMYLTSAPGQLSKDATIVAKPAQAPPPAPVASTPFTGTAIALPGTVQAEDFDNGGEGVAYHDSTAGNAGTVYRQTDVDIESSAEGGYNLGWVATGEWLTYSVNVTASGAYQFEARVAANGQGGTFHVEFNGRDATGPLTIPNTGGWQTWTTVSKTVSLTAGPQVMRVVVDSAGAVVGNFNWFRVASAPAASASTAVSLPGAIRPESFDNGGEGVSYHDTTPGNSGGAVRQTDVDIEPSSLGAYDIGWTADGEWLAYSVTVAAAGNYVVQLTVASPYSTGRIHASFGATSTATLTVPNTGGWQNWTTVSTPVTLAAGAQVMKVVFDTGGFNLAGINVATAVASSSEPPPPPPPSTGPAGGNVLTVNSGGSLQAALDAAQPGDTIVLQAGATFSGNFVLPVKSGTSYITIRSSASDSVLPGASERITPAAANLLPKIVSPNSSPALATAPGAHHYRLLFLEFLANYQGYYDVITLGDGSRAQNTLAMVPHDLIVDRVYIHGSPTYGQKRAIGLNSGATTIVNSYIAEIKASGQDSQAIGGWNGPGPYVISNNYLEAAGENLLIGGADPGIPNLVPSDITITKNYFTKQLAWRTQTQWTVKNLLELKNAQRVVIDGNVLEYSWQAAQPGYAVVFTPRNQEGTAPWSVVQQVQFTNNVVRHVASGLNILGRDDINPSQLTNDIVVRNNLFDDVSSAVYGGSGRMALVGGGANITFDHNTVIQDGWTSLYAYGPAVTGFVFTNNVIPDYSWAVIGDNTSPGNGTIAKYFPQSQFFNGIFAGSPAASYPSGNYYPANLAAVGFVDFANRNYRLAPTSPYRNSATDGTDVGCNIDTLNQAAGTKY